MKLEITLPWPPSANRYWRFVNNRVLVSREARAYKNHVIALSHTWPDIKFNDARLEVTITAHAPDKRARDLDNLIKITCDALQETGVFDNDAQIDKITIIRGVPVDKKTKWSTDASTGCAQAFKQTKAKRSFDFKGGQGKS